MRRDRARGHRGRGPAVAGGRRRRRRRSGALAVTLLGLALLGAGGFGGVAGATPASAPVADRPAPVAATSPPAASVGQDEDGGPLTVDALLDLVEVSDPEISPDGDRILYTRRVMNWDENRYDETVWVVEVESGETYRFLGHRGDGDLRWSPDGRWIGFLSSRAGEGGDAGADDEGSGPRQIWLIRPGGGEAVQLTDHDAGVIDFDWMPDGGGIVFSADDKDPEALKERRRLGDDAIFVDEGSNGQGREFWRHLWHVSLPGRPGDGPVEARRLTDGDRVVQSFDVAPDSGRVAFVYRPDNHRNAGHRAEVAVVDVDDGEVRDLTDNEAPESRPRWSPDGSTVAYLTPDDEAWELANDRFRLYDLDTGEIRPLGLDWEEGSIRDFEWTPDGEALRFAAQSRTRRNLFRISVSDGAVTRLTGHEGLVTAPSYSADGRYAAAVVESPHRPGDVYRVDLQDGDLRRLTEVNPGVGERALAEPRVVDWESTDGFRVEGVVYLPPEHREGQRHPLLLNIHGGPAGVFDYGFNGIWHVYAARGWVTLAPNVRGSSGYTDRLLRGNLGDIGGGDYRDLMSGVDHLIETGWADAERMALRGWSYGGILGGWTLTRTHRFRAASLGAMVADWRSEYAMGFNYDVRRWYIGGTPWDRPEDWLQMSAYTHVDEVDTPTILLHGEEDRTDTVGQSMIFYQALKDRGVPVRFIRFPREPHGLREPHHRRTRHVEEIRWIEEHTRGVEYEPGERPVSNDEDEPGDGREHDEEGHHAG